MSSPVVLALVAVPVFVVGLLVIKWLEPWADLVSGVLSVAALALCIYVAALSASSTGQRRAVMAGGPQTFVMPAAHRADRAQGALGAPARVAGTPDQAPRAPR
ncbi:MULTISPECIES: hypothetical protein [unclassified Methylobacterium]|uniref:hypothetical protein n=1 Tax=unclassified Methylobacterium TaxID=2615210 RepID=UPI0002E97CF1|nr:MULTISPECIES: hypothetical protein [Methylobacterium]WFT79693.1 hypothetical protein QA634_31620 [Methylobacterium nodulans]